MKHPTVTVLNFMNLDTYFPYFSGLSYIFCEIFKLSQIFRYKFASCSINNLYYVILLDFTSIELCTIYSL